MSVIKVGDVTCQPGKIQFGSLPCAYLPDSSVLSVPLIVLNGEEEGPVLWLGSAVHGPEIPGCEAIRRITRERVAPSDLRGAIIAAPIQNVIAYRESSPYIPRDGLNMNRLFPGDPEGSISHRIAYILFHEGIMKADYALDFHANANEAINFVLLRKGEGEAWQKAREMADAYGVTISELAPGREGIAGMVQDACLHAGIPSLTVELAPHYGIYDENSIQSGVTGTLNVMKYLGMIKGDPEPQTLVQVINGPLTEQYHVRASKGGIVHPLRPTGSKVSEGDALVSIFDPYGDEIETLTSPIDGYVITYPRRGNQTAASGDVVVFVFGT